MRTIEQEEGGSLVLFRSYLAMVENSVGTKMFQNLYVDRGDNGHEDVIYDGDLACAYYVSSVLRHFNLINDNGGSYTYVDSTVSVMLESGWIRFDVAVSGAVVVWPGKMCDDGHIHKHIGICVDEKYAVSNCPTARTPVKHGVHDLKDNLGQPRVVEAFYMHPRLW